MKGAGREQTQGPAGSGRAEAHPPIFAALRHPLFRSVWFANLVGNLGNLVQMVAASWLMTSIAPSAEMVALVVSANTLPILALALFAGALADIRDRRQIMLAAQWMMLGVATLLAVLTWLDLVTPWLLLALTFLLGCGAAINAPSWQASVAEQVPREDLPGAILLNSLGFNFARCAGPAIGGLVVALAGSAAAFLLNALSYVGLLYALGRWRPAKAQPALPPERLGSAMRAGLQYIVLSPLKSVLARAFFFGLAGSAIWGLMPLVARDALDSGAGAYGLLLGGFGLGAVVGAVMSARLRAWVSSERAVGIAGVVFAVAMAAVSLSHWIWLTLPALFVAGAGWVVTLSTLSVTVQMATPRWVVGRVLALFQMATYGGMAFGSWGWGRMAEASNLRLALALSAAAVLTSVLIGLRIRLPTDDVDLEPLHLGARQPLSVHPRAGPVLVSVEYRVALEEARSFLGAIMDKRRIRLRDGARRWSVMQDVADPELWLEQFESRTWAEYLRQRERPTVNDHAIEQRVLSFHRGERPPRVRRLLQRAAPPPPRGHVGLSDIPYV